MFGRKLGSRRNYFLAFTMRVWTQNQMIPKISLIIDVAITGIRGQAMWAGLNVPPCRWSLKRTRLETVDNEKEKIFQQFFSKWVAPAQRTLYQHPWKWRTVYRMVIYHLVSTRKFIQRVCEKIIWRVFDQFCSFFLIARNVWKGINYSRTRISEIYELLVFLVAY